MFLGSMEFEGDWSWTEREMELQDLLGRNSNGHGARKAREPGSKMKHGKKEMNDM